MVSSFPFSFFPMIDDDGVSLTPREIEPNKDRMDLKPNLQYVERNLPKYEEALRRFLSKPFPPENYVWISGIDVRNVVDDFTLQLPPNTALDILSHLPTEMLRISSLRALDYQYQRFIPIPNFNEEGFLDAKCPCRRVVSADIFPHDEEEDGTHIEHHPTRILIGNTHQGVIFPSFLPKTVSENRRAVEFYQIHVLLHEFFHTIVAPFRSEESAKRLVLHFQDGKSMTYADWRKAFIDSMLHREPVFPSNYASTYADQIHPEADRSSIAVEEQLCETFAAYILGRAPGNVEYDDFTTFHFGNEHPEEQLIKGYGSIRHELMDRFFHATFESKSPE